MKKNTAVHIIGAEALCSAGGTLARCIETMLTGSTRPTSPTLFDNDLPQDYPVFSVNDADLTTTDPGLSRTAHFLLSAMSRIMRDTDLRDTPLDRHRVGTCIGTSVGASLNFHNFYQEWKDGAQPDMAPIHRYLRSNPAEIIAENGGYSGPCLTVTNACTSGADAIGIGASWISNGMCDMVIAGGADELCMISYTGFARLMITSAEPCRPFDKKRTGLNLGEGTGLLILASERLLDTLSFPSLGRVIGYGTCGDSHHLTAPHPEARGLRTAIDDALAQAGLTEGDIGFINVHGTGTPTNDPVEGAVLNDRFPDTPFSATKGFTGHTLGAAGAIEAAFTLACLNRGELPPSQGFETVDPEIGRSPTMDRTPIQAKYAISQSLAFGGNNSVLILQRGDA